MLWFVLPHLDVCDNHPGKVSSGEMKCATLVKMVSLITLHTQWIDNDICNPISPQCIYCKYKYRRPEKVFHLQISAEAAIKQQKFSDAHVCKVAFKHRHSSEK
jgi:hypothetical protein